MTIAIVLKAVGIVLAILVVLGIAIVCYVEHYFRSTDDERKEGGKFYRP